MTDKTKRGRHYVYNINYHIVWGPRYRKSVLVGQIADRLRVVLFESAAKHEIDVLAHEIMPDHVHLFVSAKPKYAPSQIVRLFKGIPSRMLMAEFEYLRRQYWGDKATLWAASYYYSVIVDMKHKLR
jgi:putative transposase